MNDETRKALDGIFTPEKLDRPLYQIMRKGASKIENIQDKLVFTGKFEIRGSTLNKLRQLYDDAIAADDARKLADDLHNKSGDE